MIYCKKALKLLGSTLHERALGIEFFNISTDGARVSKDFLTQLIFNIVKKSTAFYGEIQNPGNQIFSYREGQFHSVFCPSISDITAS